MQTEKKLFNIEEVNLKNFFRTIKKRIIPFLIAFLAVFILGITYTVIISPEYSATSEIALTDDYLFYNEAIYKYLPDESNNLWIIPSHGENEKLDYVVSKIDPMEVEIKSSPVLDNVLASFNGELDKRQLKKSINVIIDRWNAFATINTYAKTAELAYNINKAVLDSYINQKNLERSDASAIMVQKLETEIKASEKALNELNNATNKDPLLNEKIKMEDDKYSVLAITKKTISENTDFFTRRIKILTPPVLDDVQNTSNYLRNILLTLIAAFLAGTISAFAVNYFKITNRNNNQ